MTIATLMATAAIFLVKGWTAPAFGALAITIGGMVCIAASNAGDTSAGPEDGVPDWGYAVEAAGGGDDRRDRLHVLDRRDAERDEQGAGEFQRMPKPVAHLAVRICRTVFRTRGNFSRDDHVADLA